MSSWSSDTTKVSESGSSPTVERSSESGFDSKDRLSGSIPTSGTGQINSDVGTEPDRDVSTLKNRDVQMSAGDFGVMDQGWNTKGGFVQAKSGEDKGELEKIEPEGWKQQAEDKWESVKSSSNDLLSSAKDQASQLSSQVGQKFEQTKDQIRAATSASSASSSSSDSGPSISEKLQSKASDLSQTASAAKDASISKITAAKDNVADKASAAKAAVVDQASAAKEKTASGLSSAKESVLAAKDSTIQSLTSAKEATLNQISSAKDSTVAALNQAKEKTKEGLGKLEQKVSGMTQSSSTTANADTEPSASSSSSSFLAQGQNLMSDLGHKAADFLHTGADKTTAAFHSLSSKMGFGEEGEGGAEAGAGGSSAAARDLREIAEAAKRGAGLEGSGQLETTSVGAFGGGETGADSTTRTTIRSTTEVDEGAAVRRIQEFEEYVDGNLVNQKKKTTIDDKAQL